MDSIDLSSSQHIGVVERWVTRLSCGFICPKEKNIENLNNGNNYRVDIKDVQGRTSLRRGDVVLFHLERDTTVEAEHMKRPYKANNVVILQERKGPISKKEREDREEREEAMRLEELLNTMVKREEGSGEEICQWEQVRGFSCPWQSPWEIPPSITPIKERETWNFMPSTVYGPPMRVVIGCTFAPDELEAPLGAWMKGITGINSNMVWVPYGSLNRELINSSSAYWSNGGKACHVILIRLEDLAQPHPELQTGRGLLTNLQSNINTFSKALITMAATDHSPCVVIVCPYTPSIYAEPRMHRVYQKAENWLMNELKEVSNIHCVGSQALREEFHWVGVYFDDQMNRLAHSPYTPSMCAAIALLTCRMIHRSIVIGRKVIVLDCDNTLWGNAVGEVGAMGVIISLPFRKLQDFMAALKRQGLLLCLCSKNIQLDVEDVFKQRANEMGFSLDDVICSSIGWGFKSDGIKSMAKKLNIGLDAFVFVDDNPVECSEVFNHTDGQVTVIQLPLDPSLYPAYLANSWAFDRPLGGPKTATKEDLQRTEQYKTQELRDTFLREAGGFNAFVASLHLNIAIEEISESAVARVAQLTERTNQFNTFKHVLAQLEVYDYCHNQGKVWTVTVTDRFGHYGLVGALFVANDKPDNVPSEWSMPATLHSALFIDGFVLSCRVLHRGVEHAMMKHLGSLATQRHRTPLALRWRPSERNEPARAFLFDVCLATCQPMDEFMEDGKEGYAIVDVDYISTLSVREIGQAVPIKDKQVANDIEKMDQTLVQPADQTVRSQERAALAIGGKLSLHWETYNSIAILVSEGYNTATHIEQCVNVIGGEALKALRQFREQSLATAPDTSEDLDPIKRQRKDCKFRRQARHGVKVLVDKANNDNSAYVTPKAPRGADNSYI